VHHAPKPTAKSENTSYTNHLEEKCPTAISGEGLDQLDYTNAEWNLPPTASIIEAWANQAIARAGHPEKRVSKMWPYRFEARVPAHLGLAPVKQKTKELRRIQAEDAGLLQHWYDQLEALLKGVPARLVYNTASKTTLFPLDSCLIQRISASLLMGSPFLITSSNSDS
jgi:hypothetical protein